MSIRKLPPTGTPELEKVIERYKNGEAETLWRELKFANRDSFITCMRKRCGVSYSESPGEPQPVEQPVINIPPIKIKRYKPFKIRGKGDPETQVLLLGDHHADEVTPTYNAEVYKTRLSFLFDRTMAITELHRNMYPINDLVVFMLGDMVHGENPYQGAKLGSATMGGASQVYELAFPELMSLLCSLKENFKTVKVYCVWGNHGRISREAPKTSNWDNMLYKALEKAKMPNGIEIYPPKDFCQIVNIGGFRFFAYHGDQITAYNGIPYFAQKRKLMMWADTFGGFSYALQGHFHEDDVIRVSRAIKGFINGALVTDDPFALERVGTSGVPCQWTFGVHNRRGVTWAYSLMLDDAFLPKREE